MLELIALNAGYGSVTALHDISLKVLKNEIVTIIGANGAGKTTLLMAIAGLLSQVSGCVRFEGAEVGRMRASMLVTMGISLVPEGRQLFPNMTVEDNLFMGAYKRRENKKNLIPEMERIYEYFPRLRERRHQLAGTLSGGEQQMAAIGRALLARPKVLMLDEPSIGLSPKFVSVIFEVICRLREEGATILLVEQNAMAALEMSDRGYVLVNGRVEMTDYSKNLLSNDIVRKSYLGFA